MKKIYLAVAGVAALILVAVVIVGFPPRKIEGPGVAEVPLTDKTQANQVVQITTDPGAQGYPGLATDGENFYVSYARVTHTPEGNPENYEVFLEKYDENWQLIENILDGNPNDTSRSQCDTNLSFYNDALYVAHVGRATVGEYLPGNYVDKYDQDLSHLETYTVPVESFNGTYEHQCDPSLLITGGGIFVPYLNLERAFQIRTRIQQFDLSGQSVKKIDVSDQQVMSMAGVTEEAFGPETGEVSYLNVRTAPVMIYVNDKYYVLSNFGPGFNAYLVELDGNFGITKVAQLTNDPTDVYNTPRALIYHNNHFCAFYTHEGTDGNGHIYCLKSDQNLNLVAKYLLTNEEGLQTYPQVVVKDGAFYMVYEHGAVETTQINEVRDSNIFVKVWREGF